MFRPDETLVYEYDPNPYTNTLGINYRYEVDVTPVLDNWLTGDMVVPGELGDSLDDENALQYDGPKYEEAPDEVAKKYTLRNDVRVAFDTNSEGTIDRDSVSVTFDGVSTPTVPEGEGVNNLADDLRTNSDGTIPGGYRPRFYNTRVTDDAVLISTIFGGYTRASEQVLDMISEDRMFDFLNNRLGWTFGSEGGADDYLLQTALSGLLTSFTDMFATVPNIYHFVEVKVRADGECFIRYWDTSWFPQHTVYVDGLRRFTTPLPFEPRERFNPYLAAFLLEGTFGYDPYYSGELTYLLKATEAGSNQELVDKVESMAEQLPTVDDAEFPSLDPRAGGTVWQWASNVPDGEMDEAVDAELSAFPLDPFQRMKDHSPV